MHRRYSLIPALLLLLAGLACAAPGTAATATPTAASVATATPTAAAAATDDPIANWPTYTNTTHGFSISHPPGFSTSPPDSAETFGALGDQIVFSVNTFNPADCRGDCPVIETTEAVTVAGQPAAKLTGYIGAIGGNTPQQYQSYVFARGDLYYTFTLYALPTGFVPTDNVIQPLQPEDIALFEQMLATLQFTT
jgi:hypothetical protein